MLRPNQPNPDQSKPGKDKNSQRKSAFLQQLDKWLEPRLNRFSFFTVFDYPVWSLLFDVKISTGGDDSPYIEMAHDFIKGKTFPSWHGPLYPIFSASHATFWC